MNKCFITDGCWLVIELNESKIGFKQGCELKTFHSSTKAASLIWACIVDLKIWPFKAVNEFYKFCFTLCVTCEVCTLKNLIVEAMRLHQWIEFNNTIQKILFSHSPVSLRHHNFSPKLENVCKTYSWAINLVNSELVSNISEHASTTNAWQWGRVGKDCNFGY
jgi:hypothetical protein